MSFFGSGAFLGGLGGGAIGLTGGVLSAINQERQQRRFRRRQRKAIGAARKFADERVAEITGGDLFSGAVDFLTGTFDDAVGTPLAQDFAKSIRAAQAQRGTLLGGAAEAQEASGLAAFAQQLRASLLPQVQQFAFAPEQFRQSILGFEAPLRVAASTGAPLPGLAAPPITPSPFAAALNQGIAGALGGAQIGLAAGELGLERQRLEAARRRREEAADAPFVTTARERMEPFSLGVTGAGARRRAREASGLFDASQLRLRF